MLPSFISEAKLNPDFEIALRLMILCILDITFKLLITLVNSKYASKDDYMRVEWESEILLTLATKQINLPTIFNTPKQG